MNNHINSQQESSDTAPVTSSSTPFSFIGDFAQRAGVSPMTIRFYEREGLLAPHRVGRFRTYDDGDERRIKSILTLRLIGLSIVKIREALAETIPEKGQGMGTRYARILQEHFGDLCRKRNEIARQMVCTADILAELGEVADEKVTSQQSCDTAAAGPLEEEIRPLIA
jgi:DNA-binding transcriptional MerR regulator